MFVFWKTATLFGPHYWSEGHSVNKLKFFFPSKSNFAPFLESVDNILNDLKHTFYYNGCIVTFQIAGQRWLRKIKMFFPFLPSIIFQCITYWIRSHVTSLLAHISTVKYEHKLENFSYFLEMPVKVIYITSWKHEELIML